MGKLIKEAVLVIADEAVLTWQLNLIVGDDLGLGSH